MGKDLESDAIAWPADGWRLVSRGSAIPGALISVSEIGNVTLSLSAAIVAKAGWSMSVRLELRAIETEATVFLSLAPEEGGALRLHVPPGCKVGVLPKRLIVRLYKCGGITLAMRARADVKHRGDGEVLQLAVPRAGVAAPPLGSRAKRSAPGDIVKVANEFDPDTLVPFALDAAKRAWRGKPDGDDRGVRIATAVALVEFGVDRDIARARLGLTNVLLPDREDMPMPARTAATAALEALREAADE